MGIPEGQSVIFYFLVTYNANICQILLKTKAQAKGKNALRDICFLSYNIRYPIVINNQGWWLNGWCYCYLFFFMKHYPDTFIMNYKVIDQRSKL